MQPERAAVKLICHGALSCKLGKSLAVGLFASLCFLKSNCTVWFSISYIPAADQMKCLWLKLVQMWYINIASLRILNLCAVWPVSGYTYCSIFSKLMLSLHFSARILLVAFLAFSSARAEIKYFEFSGLISSFHADFHFVLFTRGINLEKIRLLEQKKCKLEIIP